MNRKHLGDAVITCSGCDPFSAFGNDDSGIVYSYTAEAPHFRIWTQQQALFESKFNNFKSTGINVDVHANTLAVSASSLRATKTGAGAAFFDFLNEILVYTRPDPSSKWTFGQRLAGVGFSQDLVNLRVWEDAIFIANAHGENYQGPPFTDRFTDGRVNVFYPDLPQYMARPGSRRLDDLESNMMTDLNMTDLNMTDLDYVATDAPMQWSLRQVLWTPGYDPKTATTAADGRSFGLFDVFEDTMVAVTTRDAKVTPNTAKLYIYEREYLGGQWSVQQSLQVGTGTESRPPTVYHNMISYSNDGNGFPASFLSTDVVWDCLVVSVEDQFGDGWDGAKLRVEAPDGSKDEYAPACDTPNGLRFRYCPLSHKDVGLYKFRIVGAEKAKYPWEIQYRVFDEKSGQWYMGREHTSMDFEWDGSDKQFVAKRMQHDLPANITCKECKPRPTEKPSPPPSPKSKAKSRELKGSKKTFAPSISPAPTLGMTEGTQWEWLVMSTTAGEYWFNEQHKGTNFYISDAKAHRLVSTGTMCPWEGTRKECWQDLPEGEYVLRITGDLNPYYASHTWEFCGQQGGSREMMTFRVDSDGLCTPLVGYSKTAFCQYQLRTAVLASFDFDLVNVHLDDLNGLAKGEIIHAVTEVFPEVSADHVSIDRLFEHGDGVEVYLTVSVEVESLGFDPSDMESIPSAYVAFAGAFKNALDNGQLLAAMQSGELPTGLERATESRYVSDKLREGGVDEPNLASQDYVVDMVTSVEYADEHKNYKAGNVLGKYAFALEKYTVYGVSLGGYLMVAALIAVVAVYAVRNPSQSVRAVKRTGDDVSEALVSLVADEEDMLLSAPGKQKVLPSVTKVPQLAAKQLKKKVAGGADRAGYALVSTLDDIADGVVDFVLPPESSSDEEEEEAR